MVFVLEASLAANPCPGLSVFLDGGSDWGCEKVSNHDPGYL